MIKPVTVFLKTYIVWDISANTGEGGDSVGVIELCKLYIESWSESISCTEELRNPATCDIMLCYKIFNYFRLGKETLEERSVTPKLTNNSAECQKAYQFNHFLVCQFLEVQINEEDLNLGE